MEGPHLGRTFQALGLCAALFPVLGIQAAAQPPIVSAADYFAQTLGR